MVHIRRIGCESQVGTALKASTSHSILETSTCLVSVSCSLLRIEHDLLKVFRFLKLPDGHFLNWL